MEPTGILNNRYQLIERLGQGGMAEVFRARDLMLERDIAIKVLRDNYYSDPAFRERFRQEAKAAANLAHTNIVTVHDIGFDEKHIFIVMEYVPGENLHSIIQKKSRFQLEEGIALMVQACAGIGYAHRAGLVHCDIKPHNFIVTPDQRLKVADFGIARALASIKPDESAKVVWGSPQFFSPEQATGSAPSPASDVYSLGVVMYLMFTGQLPFLAPTTEELAKQHRYAQPIPPREINPLLPHPLEDIILKVLSKEPSARYRTADQLGRVLLTFGKRSEMPIKSGGSNIKASPPRPQSSREPGHEDAPTLKMSERVPIQENPIVILGFDWVAVLLSLVAFVGVGGLIPFWIWVYIVFNPPVR